MKVSQWSYSRNEASQPLRSSRQCRISDSQPNNRKWICTVLLEEIPLPVPEQLYEVGRQELYRIYIFFPSLMGFMLIQVLICYEILVPMTGFYLPGKQSGIVCFLVLNVSELENVGVERSQLFVHQRLHKKFSCLCNRGYDTPGFFFLTLRSQWCKLLNYPYERIYISVLGSDLFD